MKNKKQKPTVGDTGLTQEQLESIKFDEHEMDWADISVGNKVNGFGWKTPNRGGAL